MNFKTYIFGLGSGLLVVSIIFYLVFSINLEFISVSSTPNTHPPNKEKLSDQEIIDKAKELGMVFKFELNALQPSATPSALPSSLPSTLPSLSPSPKNEVVVINIEPGEISSNVSLKLEQLGVIDDKKAFLSYLKNHNLTTKIASGAISLNKNSDYETVAKKITKN